MPFINTGIGTVGIGRIGALLSLKPPTFLTSSFTVDTILGQLNWTDTNGGKAQYEVYSSTNSGADILLATTALGATSHQDLICKQNASVVYKLKAKIGSKTTDFVSATSLNTPLCWKTNQSILTPSIINTLNIAVGKSVTINYSDGSNYSYSGNNVSITKNFAAIGQYNVWITGDVDYIINFQMVAQQRIEGVITNWLYPTNLSVFSVRSTNMSGVIPNQRTAVISDLNFQVWGCYFSDSNLTVFRRAMTNLNISNQNVVFSTANINKLLKALADFYQTNAPTANCTIDMSGVNMGIPTGGSANADLTRLVGYYTAQLKSCTVLIRTS